jgi:putative hydroxymethylpyrimidine transport system ATP-binding protein
MTEWLLNLINEYDATVLMVTHYLDEAILFSDRIFVIQDCSIKNTFTINFNKERTQELKFTDEFKNYKQILFNSIN